MGRLVVPGLLLCLVLLTSFVSSSHATLAEGGTLISILNQWQAVSFPTWVPGTDPCQPPVWENVTCDQTGFVVELNISNRNIIGPLPPQIGDLVHLEVLDVSNLGGNLGRNLTNKNQFTGGIPDALSKLTALKALNLSTIGWNSSFPQWIPTLTNLEEIFISEANLVGPLPPKLFTDLKKLRHLYAGGNNLQANLEDFASITTLTELTFWGNNLNQTIPPEFGNLTQLTYLNLHDTSLFGALPDSFGNLVRLDTLQLYNNLFTGRIPESWRALKKLMQLRMDSNYFTEEFPLWLLTDLPGLLYLMLSGSNFYGRMPDPDLFNKFQDLRLDCNYFNGTDPFPNNSSTYKYRTKYNCYDGASASDLKKITGQCKKTLDCATFRADVILGGQCAPCPPYQYVRKGNPITNPCVCGYGGGPKHPSKGVPVGAVVGGILGLLAVFVVVVGYILWKRREHFAFLDRFKVKKEEVLGDWEIPAGVQRFSAEELAKITDNFNDSHVIGAGGFGKVFFGQLDDGRTVAIKCASLTSLQGATEFRNEITLLSRLHHRHLVRLEGFCDEADLQVLVYEFMKKGNLHSHLLGKITSTPLHWYKRLEIAVGVAQGLEYLHSFADPPVIHRDVKPSNILLDDNMVAKLADFGISKATAEFDTHVSTKPAGTAGYLDPEYFLRRQLTTASDVYAFGVVLLELVTGQEAIDHKRHEEYNLIEWVRKRYKTGGIVSIIDPLIEYEYSKDAYCAMTELALACTTFNKDERPNMKTVLSTLEPHLAIQSLYGPSSIREKGERKEEEVEPTPQHRGVYITFDPEYLDTSVPTEVHNMKMVAENLGPR